MFPTLSSDAFTLAKLKNESPEMQQLLETLTVKELRSLHKNPDLLDRVKEISILTMEEIWDILEKEFYLDMQKWGSDDVWVGTSKLEARYPKWANSKHSGWVFTDIDEVLLWGKHFLLQEIRINLWIRYLEAKNEQQKKENQSVDETDLLMGVYRGYPG